MFYNFDLGISFATAMDFAPARIRQASGNGRDRASDFFFPNKHHRIAF